MSSCKLSRVGLASGLWAPGVAGAQGSFRQTFGGKNIFGHHSCIEFVKKYRDGPLLRGCFEFPAEFW